ncbi:MAG: diadenylate cyclase [Planctomycetota bacterium]|jgi:diadenylate cyclase
MFLRYVRATRGSRLIRGMVVSVTIGVLGLWGLANWLELEELNFLLQSVAGYIIVIFAILFQPELRRGITQIGDRQLGGRLRRQMQDDVLEEVSKAVTAMAARRHGALIAFEREAPLSMYIEGGVSMDSAVRRLVVETVFFPGGALHDGALIVRKDRIAAASCLFPLTKNPEFSRLRGTRHRAALGLTEETDAVTVAASEETGSISVCSNGVMHENVAPTKLKQVLLATLGSEEFSNSDDGRRTGWLNKTGRTFKQDFLWIAISLLIAFGILLIANREASTTQSYQLRLVQRTRDLGQEVLDGELAMVLPNNMRLASEFRNKSFEIKVTGTRGQQIDFGAAPAGIMELEEAEAGQTLLNLSTINWRHDAIGVRYDWVDGSDPQVEIELIARSAFNLSHELVDIDATNLDPHYEVRRESLQFDHGDITLVGPADQLKRLEDGDLQLKLATIFLGPEHVSDRRAGLDLAPELKRLDLSIESDEVVYVTIPILPATHDLDTITSEVALICTDYSKTAQLDNWELPDIAEFASFSIRTSGLIPASIEAGSVEGKKLIDTIINFVQDNLTVFVDIAELPAPGEGQSVPVRWYLREDWREALDLLAPGVRTLGGRETLDIELESDKEVLLEEVVTEVNSTDGKVGDSSGSERSNDDSDF